MYCNYCGLTKNCWGGGHLIAQPYTYMYCAYTYMHVQSGSQNSSYSTPAHTHWTPFIPWPFSCPHPPTIRPSPILYIHTHVHYAHPGVPFHPHQSSSTMHVLTLPWTYAFLTTHYPLYIYVPHRNSPLTSASSPACIQKSLFPQQLVSGACVPRCTTAI